MMASNLAVVMLAAESERRSGVFDVSSVAGSHTRVYVAGGRIVFADAGALGDALGRVLVREGKLTTEQYWTALDYMTQRLDDATVMRFGEVVVTLGFLGPAEVHDAL